MGKVLKFVPKSVDNSVLADDMVKALKDAFSTAQIEEMRRELEQGEEVGDEVNLET